MSVVPQNLQLHKHTHRKHTTRRNGDFRENGELRHATGSLSVWVLSVVLLLYCLSAARMGRVCLTERDRERTNEQWGERGALLLCVGL